MSPGEPVRQGATRRAFSAAHTGSPFPSWVTAFIAFIFCWFAFGCEGGEPIHGAPAPTQIGKVQDALSANGGSCTLGTQCTSGYCKAGLCSACTVDSTCPTNSYCSSGVCQTKKSTFGTCTASDQCQSANCTFGFCFNCGSNGNCDDGNPCTTDTCAGSTCQSTAATGAGCDDGNVCTSNSTCSSAGVCNGTLNTANGTACTSGRCESGACCSSGCGTDGSGTCTALASESSTVCGASGSVCSTCNDGLSCTTDSCSTATGACVNTPTSGNCAIAGVCYANGTVNPSNACQSCNTATSTTAWSSKSNGASCTGGRCESGACCTSGCGTDGSGTCTALASETSTVCGASGAVCASCNDGLSCTTDACSASGVCSNALIAGNCVIAGVCYANGTANPSNSCQICSAATTTSAWTSTSNGASCTGGRCESGACCTSGCGTDGSGTCTALASESSTVCGATGAVCASCNDGLSCTTDSCSASGVCSNAFIVGNCVIAGVCYANGTVNPSNACQSCNTATSTITWSGKSNGASCTGGRCESGSCCSSGCGTDGSGTCTALASESPTVCGASGAVCATCNDGLACTTDSCSASGVCSNALAAGNCVIGGACYANGAANPANSCQLCTTATSTSAWSSKSNGTSCTGGRCETGSCCTSGCGTDGSGTCTALASETSTVCGASGAVCSSCSDGLSCTTDTCSTTTGACSNAVSAGNCLVAGACYANGAVNPSNGCQSCNSATSTTAWTISSNGASCTGGRCETGSCCTSGCGTDGLGTCTSLASETSTVCGASGAVCASCNDGLSCTTDACSASGVCTNTLAAASCVIAGVCYANGTVNPSNGCQSCNSATSTSAWSSKSNGTSCTGGRCESGACCTTGCGTDGSGACTALASESSTVCGASGAVCASCNDGLSCTTDACSASGVCTNTLAAASCVIAGVCYANGTVNPSNGCQSCNSATSTTAWTTSSNGASCTGGRCETGLCCSSGCGTDGSGTCTALASESTTVCGASGSVCASCSDGLSCTTDSCSASGVCSNALIAGNCVIGGACYANGTANPANSCQICSTATTTSAWTSTSNGASCTGGRCETGSCCTSGCGTDGLGTCTSLASETSTVCGASGAVCASCNDGLSCTTDACSATGVCTNTLAAASCVIAGVCFANGTVNPSNGCQSCNSATSTTAWTNSSNGASCTGGRCESGACCTSGCGTDGSGACTALASESATVCGAKGATCSSCNDGLSCTTDGCNTTTGACSNTLIAGNCVIGGACYANGAANPSNGCQSCNTATTTTAWTTSSNGTACTGGRCESGACCSSGCGVDGAGTCTALASESAAACGATGSACTSCNDGNTCTTDVCSTPSGACTNLVPTACANGLTGAYYNYIAASYPPATGPSGSANLTRVDANVNFNWATGSPSSPTINSDNFYIVWTGQVLADVSGTYTFSTTSDDGSTLSVNGTTVVNNWFDQGATTRSGTINLTGGVRYDVQIIYYEHTGGASMVASWQPPSAASSVAIPSDHLFAQSGTCSPCDDSNPCTADSCGSSSCGHANVADGIACPGGVCTAGSCCGGCLSAGVCLSLAVESGTACGAAGSTCASCDDGNPCTVDGCSAGGCTHTAGNSGTLCRAAVSVCDFAESCTGTSTTCPADGFVTSGTLCRASAGVCDVAESCTGTSPTCPVDGFATIGAACADDGNPCTNDYCSGASAACSHPTAASCQNGLTVTYYDNIDYTGPNVNRVDGTVDFDWSTGSPDASLQSTTYSARWTGQVLADFAETYTFETEADDGVRLWVNNVLLVDDYVDQGSTKKSGTITLTAGTRYDVKMDYYQDGGGADAHLRWSSPSTPYEVIPQDHLFASGDLGLGGLAWNNGGNNGTGDPYVVWQLSKTPGTAPVNVSASSSNNWGLGTAVMMVPSFSPDGKKLVFITGDSGDGAGWRKGLSTFDFNESSKTFSNRRSVRNTWPLGDVMKWPVWEPDSRSIVFQTSTPTELCTTCDGKTGYRYGNMAPTNYYGAPGRLWSIDSSGTGTAIELANLDTGERPADAAKSYQPTMLPVAAGGYRWAVFTSTRPYGNTLNPPGIATSCTASQLWVSAVDDATSSTVDRSHPGFWLPNQNLAAPTQSSYVNERAYWVLDPCKPVGTGSASVCTSNDDCCNAPAAASCRIDQPATTPLTRHCVATNPSVCSADGGSCSADKDCCAYPSSHCITGVCEPPAPVPDFPNGIYTRDYVGNCPTETTAVWRFFDWQTVTPSDSKIVFSAQVASSTSGLATATPVTVGTASGAPTVSWVGADVGAALANGGQPSQKYLRVTMNLDASSDGFAAPILVDWRQSYSCLPSQ